MNWIGICGKERTGKTGVTFAPLSLKETILQVCWTIDFDMEGDE